MGAEDLGINNFKYWLCRGGQLYTLTSYIIHYIATYIYRLKVQTNRIISFSIVNRPFSEHYSLVNNIIKLFWPTEELMGI